MMITNQPKPPSFKSNQSGFVLVMSISMIAIAFLASSYIASWIDNEVAKRNNFPHSAQQSIDDFSTLSTITYLASTHPYTYAGLAFPQRQNEGYTLPLDGNGDPNIAPQGNELRLDNRLYQGLGKTLFRIQDEAGLISVNTLSTNRMAAILSMTGNNPRRANQQLARLKDYIDADSEYRPDGAESRQYDNQGLNGPANRRLRTPQELANVLGWLSNVTEYQFQRIEPFLTARPVSLLNINTAPKESLMINGLTATQIDKVLAYREKRAISFGNIQKLLPGAGEAIFDQFQYYASSSLKVSIISDAQGRSEVYHLRFTPLIQGAKPWHTRYKQTDYAIALNNAESAVSTGKAIFSE